MRCIFLIACLALSACATSAPSSSQWSRIEGCWREHWPDIWPASIEWRRDTAHAGAYVGQWRREAAQMDMEELRVTLTPHNGGMQLCLHNASGPDRCAPAVFGRAGWRQDGVAVVVVSGDYHEFGFAGAAQPFFAGRRADCS